MTTTDHDHARLRRGAALFTLSIEGLRPVSAISVAARVPTLDF
jgi:hypothetical protein